MFLFWLLWIVVVIGGFYMGIGYGLQMYRQGFETSLLLNTVIYLGCAFYGAPKFLKLILKR
ncbi:MAG: hypothetical protein JSS81_28145 [Acidobacteria bacterium]|nr:hypothetical protein [Acidobacteriota bacterium]